MRLPRRVPWACISELEQVCSWIYADEEDLEANALAINRLSAWKAATPLPHALESALDILTARMLDGSYPDISFAQTALVLRQTYATAIIRMVNGFVDPLQSGAYARSIATIATQLGLPSWLVELRHAATHEDLPSLELLREAGKESLSWLLHNYFYPTLNSSVPAATSSIPSRPVTPLVRSYKLLMKTVARDSSLRKQYSGKIDAVMHDIKRWIAEAKISAELAIDPLEWSFENDAFTPRINIKEKWALDLVCNALLQRGAIVPVSKRKCRVPADSFLPAAVSLALWTPLLMELREAYPVFPSIFTARIISLISDDSTGSNIETDMIELDSESILESRVHREWLARWANWAAETWTDDSECGTDLKRDIIIQVAPLLIPGQNFGHEAKILNELLHAIFTGCEGLEECAKLLRSAATAPPIHAKPWQAHDLANMQGRLQMLTADEPRLLKHGSTVKNSPTLPGRTLAAGWRLLDHRARWTPCPIGVFHSNQHGA